MRKQHHTNSSLRVTTPRRISTKIYQNISKGKINNGKLPLFATQVVFIRFPLEFANYAFNLLDIGVSNRISNYKLSGIIYFDEFSLLFAEIFFIFVIKLLFFLLDYFWIFSFCSFVVNLIIHQTIRNRVTQFDLVSKANNLSHSASTVPQVWYTHVVH